MFKKLSKNSEKTNKWLLIIVSIAVLAPLLIAIITHLKR